MVKTLRRTISDTIQNSYELPSEALKVLDTYNRTYSNNKLINLHYTEDDFSTYVYRPIYYLTVNNRKDLDPEAFFGPNMLYGKLIFMQKYITITTDNFAESFSNPDQYIVPKAVHNNILSFLGWVIFAINKLDDPNFDQFSTSAIRSLFLTISKKAQLQYESAITLISVYISIAKKYLSKANMQLNDQVLNDSFVKAIKVYIDSAFQIALKDPGSNKYDVFEKLNKLNDFSNFLNFIIAVEQELVDNGHSDILEQLKQNVRKIFSKDILDKIVEINEEYVNTLKIAAEKRGRDSDSPQSEEKLNAISDPLDSILKSHGIQVN